MPIGTTDIVGTTIPLTANLASWNRSAATGNIYSLPVDTTPVTHTIGWLSGGAPVVNAPGGWTLFNPVTGALAASYTYGGGGGGVSESYGWTADIADSIFWPI